MSKPFIHYLRVRYSECDPQNVVFNAKYAEFTDVAATEFARALWGGHSNLLASGIDSQVVNLAIDFRSAATFDDVLAIEVSVAHVGNTSYSFKMVMSKYTERTQQLELIAEAKVTYVMVDNEHYKKIKIPDSMRRKLEEGISGVVSNQAGIEL